jgi:Tfp pilus assembly protein PilF
MGRLLALMTLAVCVPTAAVAQSPSGERSRAMVPYRLGFESMRAEAWEDAAKSFQSAIDIDPTFDLAYYMLGRARMPQKQYAAAVAAFARARDLVLAGAGRHFATAQEAQRARREKVIDIDELLRQYRLAPPTQQTLGTIRQLEERRRQLQENIKQGNDMTVDATVPAYVSLSLGSAYFRTGNLGDAEKYYKEAIATDPKAGEAHSNLAVVYLTTGRIEEAEKAVNAAEKAGFRVNPALKEDIKAAKKKSS